MKIGVRTSLCAVRKVAARACEPVACASTRKFRRPWLMDAPTGKGGRDEGKKARAKWDAREGQGSCPPWINHSARKAQTSLKGLSRAVVPFSRSRAATTVWSEAAQDD